MISQRPFELCSGQKLILKNKKWAITQKLCRIELSFLCTALLLNEIHPPMKTLGVWSSKRL
jgi:hypothetical protein